MKNEEATQRVRQLEAEFRLCYARPGRATFPWKLPTHQQLPHTHTHTDRWPKVERCFTAENGWSAWDTSGIKSMPFPKYMFVFLSVWPWRHADVCADVFSRAAFKVSDNKEQHVSALRKHHSLVLAIRRGGAMRTDREMRRTRGETNEGTEKQLYRRWLSFEQHQRRLSQWQRNVTSKAEGNSGSQTWRDLMLQSQVESVTGAFTEW